MKRREFIRSLLGVPAAITAASLGIAAAAPTLSPEKIKSMWYTLWPNPRKVTIREGLPPVAWRKINEGVSASHMTATELERMHNEKLEQIRPVIDNWRSELIDEMVRVASRRL